MHKITKLASKVYEQLHQTHAALRARGETPPHFKVTQKAFDAIKRGDGTANFMGVPVITDDSKRS